MSDVSQPRSLWWDTTNVLHDDDDLAMKARAMKSGVLRQSQVIASVVQTNSLKNKEVKASLMPSLVSLAPRSRRTETYAR